MKRANKRKYEMRLASRVKEIIHSSVPVYIILILVAKISIKLVNVAFNRSYQIGLEGLLIITGIIIVHELENVFIALSVIYEEDD